MGVEAGKLWTGVLRDGTRVFIPTSDKPIG